MSLPYKIYTMKPFKVKKEGGTATSPTIQSSAGQTGNLKKGERAKVACQRCKRRKSRCDGKSVCGGCVAANAECVYKNREKRVNISERSYVYMQRKIEELEKKLNMVNSPPGETKAAKDEEPAALAADTDDKFPESIKQESYNEIDYGVNHGSADADVEQDEEEDGESEHGFTNSVDLKDNVAVAEPAGDNFQIDENDINLEAGSGDIVVKKLGEIRKLVFPKNRIMNIETSNYDSMELRTRIFKTFDINQAISLIEDTNFFLNNVYLAFDASMLIDKVSSFFKRGFLQIPNSDRSWRTLFYIIFALGKQYNGELINNPDDDANISVLLKACLSDLFEFTANWDEIHVVSLTLLACFFRSYGADDKAIVYSDLSIDISIRLGLHLDTPGPPVPEDNLKKQMENEIKSRVWWSAYLTNRFLCVKLGHSFTTPVSKRPYPRMILFNKETNTLEPIPFPNALDMANLIDLSKISDNIVCELYSRSTTGNSSSSNDGKHYLSKVKGLLDKLTKWNISLSENLKLDFQDKKYQSTMRQRLVYSFYLNHCYNVHLITIPVLYHLMEQKLKNKETKLANLSNNVNTLVTLSFNSSKLILNILTACFNEMVLAVFGSMDTDYLFSCSITFLIGYYLNLTDKESCKESLDTCVKLFQVIANRGNKNAEIKLIKILALSNCYIDKGAQFYDSNLTSNEGTQTHPQGQANQSQAQQLTTEQQVTAPLPATPLLQGQGGVQPTHFQLFSTIPSTPNIPPMESVMDPQNNSLNTFLDFGSEESDFWEEAYASLVAKMDNGI